MVPSSPIIPTGPDMNADETEIFEFLKTFQGLFVSVTEISKRINSRRRYEQDRTWARPILRRMELDGILESNPFGEYRIKQTGLENTTFKEALRLPNVPLGDTAIIMLSDVEESGASSETGGKPQG